MKTCSKCLITKSLQCFDYCKTGRDKHRCECKPCRSAKLQKWRLENLDKVRDQERRSGLKKKFNLSVEKYEYLHDQQNGVCKICKLKETAFASNKMTAKRLAVDHCHETGKIRGLLCSSCNTGLGKFKDNPDLLLAARRYIINK